MSAGSFALLGTRKCSKRSVLAKSITSSVLSHPIRLKIPEPHAVREISVQMPHNEIAQALKQVGVAFLPPLETDSSFKILLYSIAETNSSSKWHSTHPHFVHGEMVDQLELRGVNTASSKITSAVSFKNP